MEKFEMDLSLVHKTIYKDPGKLAVQGNEHRMVRVAFDLFRLKGDESDDLWQIQADDDGQEFLVRTYSLPEDEKEITASNWSVLEDTKHANLTVLYKGMPIHRLNTVSLGASGDAEIAMLRSTILRKLASDVHFELSFFESLPAIKQDVLKQAGFNPDSSLEGIDPRLIALEASLRIKEAKGSEDPLGIGENLRADRKADEHKSTEKKEKEGKGEMSEEKLNELFGGYFANKDKESK